MDVLYSVLIYMTYVKKVLYRFCIYMAFAYMLIYN